MSEDDGLREELIDNEFIAYKKAKECFSLLLYQNSRDKQADELLLVDGFTHRLSSYVFNYPMEKDTLPRSEDAADSSKHLQVVDNVLNTNSINHLSKVFRPNSPFWLEHNYDITSNASRSVGYFSYLYPLTGRKASNSIEQIIDAIYPLVTEKFPIAKSATIGKNHFS